MSVGYIYVLSNPGMPGLLKVGFTLRDVAARAQELETTGVPYKFIIEYEVAVKDVEYMERHVHSALSKFHVNKEWFRCDVLTCVSIIERIVSGKTCNKKSIKDIREQEKRKQREREKEFYEWRKFQDITMSISSKHFDRVNEKEKEVLNKYSKEIERDKNNYNEKLYIRWICVMLSLTLSMCLYHGSMDNFFKAFLGSLAMTFPIFLLIKKCFLDDFKGSDDTKKKIKSEVEAFKKEDNTRYKAEVISALRENGLLHREDVKNFISSLDKYLKL